MSNENLNPYHSVINIDGVYSLCLKHGYVLIEIN